MDTLNTIFGIVTLASFALALYEHLEKRKSAAIEQSKIRLHEQRIKDAKFSLVTAAEAVDLIVQRSKETSSTSEELRSVARVARGQLRVIVRQLAQEEEKLATWEYGKLFVTPPGSLDETTSPGAQRGAT